ncbi:MAG: bifunctional riboflavin kinase/FAD synthetase [Bacteroidia bacterium]|nr:bifunctional riboflavin kinase/FAD synthetase [Bacteroidia bacterium]MCO5253586.1 bifunctional riboflavin kinase/FAD synthetase [Bacteroidota bacterium]
MKLFTSLPFKDTFKNAVLTQGTFDGVHLGHRKIIERMKEIASKVGGETVLLTFYPHPRHVLNTHPSELKLLSTMEEKIVLLEEAGLDNLVMIPFNPEFASIEPEDFVRDILFERFNVNTFVVGYDHRFGKHRRGDYSLLNSLKEKYQFDLVQIGAQEADEMTVSSTNIRKALLNGDLKTANDLLGRPYIMIAEVVDGLKLGRTLSFPTANLQIKDMHKLIPAHGVYAVSIVIHGKKYFGMSSIGANPTIVEKGFSIEVNIFNFANSIYGEEIQVNFVHLLREERKFDSLDELKAQLINDKIEAENILYKPH